MIHGPGGASLAALALLSACASPSPSVRSWVEDEPARAAPGEPRRLPDLPDAFRAELRGGRAPGCPLRGEAVYLGEGRFLTAAHLVDDIVPGMRHCSGAPIPTTIRFRDRVLHVRPVRIGQGYVEPGVGPLYRQGQDLALLQAGMAPPGPAARPCAGGPKQGQPVLVLATNRREAVRAGPVVPESRPADGAYTDLPLPMAEGESGAGVFDLESGCLLGIVSHRPDSMPGHVRIVPADAIRAFLGT